MTMYLGQRVRSGYLAAPDGLRAGRSGIGLPYDGTARADAPNPKEVDLDLGHSWDGFRTKIHHILGGSM